MCERWSWGERLKHLLSLVVPPDEVVDDVGVSHALSYRVRVSDVPALRKRV